MYLVGGIAYNKRVEDLEVRDATQPPALASHTSRPYHLEPSLLALLRGFDRRRAEAVRAHEKDLRRASRRSVLEPRKRTGGAGAQPGGDGQSDGQSAGNVIVGWGSVVRENAHY